MLNLHACPLVRDGCSLTILLFSLQVHFNSQIARAWFFHRYSSLRLWILWCSWLWGAQWSTGSSTCCGQMQYDAWMSHLHSQNGHGRDLWMGAAWVDINTTHPPTMAYCTGTFYCTCTSLSIPIVPVLSTSSLLTCVTLVMLSSGVGLSSWLCAPAWL